MRKSETYNRNEIVVMLLQYFSLPQEQQWALVDPTIPTMWYALSHRFETDTDKPIYSLAGILAFELGGWRGREPQLRPIDFEMQNEIRVLLQDYILENVNDFIFAKRKPHEIDDMDLIWRTLSRLCKLFLSDLAIMKNENPPLTMENVRKILEQYGDPMSEEKK